MTRKGHTKVTMQERKDPYKEASIQQIVRLAKPRGAVGAEWISRTQSRLVWVVHLRGHFSTLFVQVEPFIHLNCQKRSGGVAGMPGWTA